MFSEYDAARAYRFLTTNLFVVFIMMQIRLVHRYVTSFLLFICHFSCCLHNPKIYSGCIYSPALCKITSRRRQRLTDLHFQKASSSIFSSPHYLHYDCNVLWCVTQTCRQLLGPLWFRKIGEWNILVAKSVYWSFIGRFVKCRL